MFHGFLGVANAARFSHLIDLRIMTSIGENLLSVVRGDSTVLEHMARDNMLEEFYRHSLGFPVMNQWLARMAKQLVHQYPAMKILEIGKSGPSLGLKSLPDRNQAPAPVEQLN